MKNPETCMVCNKPLAGKRKGATTCSSACRQAKYRTVGFSRAKMAKQMQAKPNGPKKSQKAKRPTGKAKIASLNRRSRMIGK